MLPYKILDSRHTNFSFIFKEEINRIEKYFLQKENNKVAKEINLLNQGHVNIFQFVHVDPKIDKTGSLGHYGAHHLKATKSHWQKKIRRNPVKHLETSEKYFWDSRAERETCEKRILVLRELF